MRVCRALRHVDPPDQVVHALTPRSSVDLPGDVGISANTVRRGRPICVRPGGDPDVLGKGWFNRFSHPPGRRGSRARPLSWSRVVPISQIVRARNGAKALPAWDHAGDKSAKRPSRPKLPFAVPSPPASRRLASWFDGRGHGDFHGRYKGDGQRPYIRTDLSDRAGGVGANPASPGIALAISRARRPNRPDGLERPTGRSEAQPRGAAKNLSAHALDRVDEDLDAWPNMPVTITFVPI